MKISTKAKYLAKRRRRHCMVVNVDVLFMAFLWMPRISGMLVDFNAKYILNLAVAFEFCSALIGSLVTYEGLTWTKV